MVVSFDFWIIVLVFLRMIYVILYNYIFCVEFLL